MECETAEVVPSGDDVVVETETAGVKQSFLVHPETQGSDEVFTIAYVETSAGSTTQIVRAPWRNASSPRQVHR